MPLFMDTFNNIFTRKTKTKLHKRTPRRKFLFDFLPFILHSFYPIETPASTGVRCYPLRLGPGIELISTIHELMEDIGVQSLFILSCVGTLSQCSLNSRQLNKKEYDIVSLSGTFDRESQNLMGSFADPQTGTLIGGRVHSLIIHTTCEIMLAEPLDCSFFREFDPRTGNNELVIRRKLVTDF
jgi:predicted DNA-binding protein with PD1-like motif